jgi:diadenosine tetraphosphate (Ap4A) HIT family hydrolase
VLVLNGHCKQVSGLTAGEWADLHPCIARTTVALDNLFAPDQYNFAFLMNLDPHVHLHVVPRYASSRTWHGETYADAHYGSLFSKEERLAPEDTMTALAEALRERL